MKSRYLTETERPEYDALITRWLDEQSTDVDSIPYKIALYHDGYMYRSITCSGLGEYSSASSFLESQGLVNALKPDETCRGYDALFVTAQEYKKAFPAR
ncbi:hypothetical protein FEM41_02005 [Jejubacter calystegiae]|uniref:Uncharacterized protein n=1 Tax=Jejubacter calystegiae TaxID=2579935 RepID=A0A4P8YFS2_9ENTR|nr:hypothetical protein [Jejubacter calystegiae]QCT18498.1 hypothetical protein FEM41_02005 [Jejubacter calystegiae]